MTCSWLEIFLLFSLFLFFDLISFTILKILLIHYITFFRNDWELIPNQNAFERFLLRKNFANPKDPEGFSPHLPNLAQKISQLTIYSKNSCFCSKSAYIFFQSTQDSMFSKLLCMLSISENDIVLKDSLKLVQKVFGVQPLWRFSGFSSKHIRVMFMVITLQKQLFLV